jgi:hypothetical protein
VSYLSGEIETLAQLSSHSRRFANLLRRIASKIDGQEPEPRRGGFAVKVGGFQADVEVLAYSSALGQRYFLKFAPIPEAAAETACAEMRRLYHIDDDRPCSSLFGNGNG